MARGNRTSASREKNIELQNTVHTLSPTEVLDTTDPGDETQQRYRYQHAYGVILLAASICHKQPYVAIWCEQYEDLLGERSDGLYDAYQIKTQQPEYGLWNLTKDSLKDSIKRFVELDQRFPGRIHEFRFVSNVGYENSKAQDKIWRSPVKFLKAIQNISSQEDLTSLFDKTFSALCAHCNCDPPGLISVIKKLKLIKGPDLNDFEAVIAQQHLPSLPSCSSWPAIALGLLCNELIARVYQASSLSIDDPARHWCCLYEKDHLNPRLRAKRVAVGEIDSFINEHSSRFLNMSKAANGLSERLLETLRLYLGKSFIEDMAAKLDQAGETDLDPSTPLGQVFVDLDLKPLSDRPPKRIKSNQLPLFELTEQPPDRSEILPPSREKVLSGMDCLLKEVFPKIVIIGGPGQGKSTLGQYIGQVHRAILLDRERDLYRNTPGSTKKQKEFKPKILRIPFRIVLKYFAQWLADSPAIDTVEAYIAAQICKGASRPGEVSAPDVQEILRNHPTLIILDGLDEVMKQELRARMIARVEEFLERAELFDANIQVLATSRPTGYSGQFNPRQYWHLELQPMAVEKVWEYTDRWTSIKVELDEERRRVLDTLKECLREEHTRLLLTTPLQVTIVLLIIKDAGRPPTRREALFQQYWDTILRREKSKATDIIRSEDTTLFDLHAYLGYVLHRRAAAENVRSLLSMKNFEELVYGFLRKDDEQTSEKALRQRVAQIVEEARYRLVLLVEPEPGLFGFELRSLQEFFAAAYLVQTAHDTNQRFERFTAIARSDHWHNVALFFAGRVVRSFRGEAEYILIHGCQPIDREVPDLYLQRGAWLALDIATDGAFADNRNLQYSALEYALTILNTGMTDSNQKHLTAALRHLSPEDRRDILSRILKQKRDALPLSCLLRLLENCSKFLGSKQGLIQGLEVLLSSNEPEYIHNAINLSFQFKVDPRWLATQLEKYWQIWITQSQDFLWRQWQEGRQFAQTVISALSLSEDQFYLLLNNLFSDFAYRVYGAPTSFEIMENPRTFSDQIIVFFQCVHILCNIDYKGYRIISNESTFATNGIEIHFYEIEKNYKWQSDRFDHLNLVKTLDQLMKHRDLVPQLRECLWALYWQIHEPTETTVTNFFEESNTWTDRKVLSTNFWKVWLRPSWPLLAFVQKSLLNIDQNTLKLLLPYLNKSQEIAISHQIYAAIEKQVQSLSSKEQSKFFLNLYSGSVPANIVPELAPIVGQLGIDISEFIQMYIYTILRGEQEYQVDFIKEAFSVIGEVINQSPKVRRMLWFIADQKWSTDQEVLNQGKQLLNIFIKRLPQQSDMLSEVVFLFLKLLAFDRTVLSLAPSLLSAMVNPREDLITNIWIVTRIIADIPSEHMADLTHFTNYKDESIQQGSFILWEALIKAFFSEFPHRITSLPQKLKALRLDWQLGFASINDANIARRKRGITLLTLSDFPITEEKYYFKVLQALARAQDMEEIKAWAFFLEFVSTEAQPAAWQTLLEQILAQPQKYSPSILTTTMERYSALVGEAGPAIMGDEVALGLPVVAQQER